MTRVWCHRANIQKNSVRPSKSDTWQLLDTKLHTWMCSFVCVDINNVGLTYFYHLISIKVIPILLGKTLLLFFRCNILHFSLLPLWWHHHLFSGHKTHMQRLNQNAIHFNTIQASNMTAVFLVQLLGRKSSGRHRRPWTYTGFCPTWTIILWKLQSCLWEYLDMHLQETKWMKLKLCLF